MNKTNKKGFTLAELLIVVAIIAVLVAIAIPVFTSQLEKAREAVDLANLRTAYAECTTDVMTNGSTSSYKLVKPTQTKSGWVTDFETVGSIKKVDVIDMKTGTNVYMVVNADGTASITTTTPTSGNDLS